MQFLGLFYALEYVQVQYRSDTYRRTQIKVRNKIKPETARKTIPQRNLHQQVPLRYYFSIQLRPAINAGHSYMPIIGCPSHDYVSYKASGSLPRP